LNRLNQPLDIVRLRIHCHRSRNAFQLFTIINELKNL
jgi:hypothetical protein